MDRKARWLKIRFISVLFGLFKCSECGKWNEKTNFCPECGAATIMVNRFKKYGGYVVVDEILDFDEVES